MADIKVISINAEVDGVLGVMVIPDSVHDLVLRIVSHESPNRTIQFQETPDTVALTGEDIKGESK